MMASTEGGMEIEEVAAKHPEKILKVAIDPVTGMQGFHARKLAFGLGLEGKQVGGGDQVHARRCTRPSSSLDASIVEINPLVVTGAGDVMALDAKMNFDDNALFRHPDIEEMRDEAEEDPTELEAAKHSLNYVKLDGNIGCMVNGAGLAMATMDIIKLYGGEPANFLDVGGGATKERVTTAFKLILSRPAMSKAFWSTSSAASCAATSSPRASSPRRARSACMCRWWCGSKAPMCELGKKILAESGLPILSADNLADAAEKVVKAVKEAA